MKTFLSADLHLNAEPKPGHAIDLRYVEQERWGRAFTYLMLPRGWYVVRTAAPIPKRPDWYAITAVGPYPSPEAGKMAAAVALLSTPENPTVAPAPIDPATDQACIEALVP